MSQSLYEAARAVEIRKNVARGAEMLDRFYPDWHKHVDLDTLDMFDTRRCVLAQLYGTFRMGMNELGDFTPDWPQRHGFDCTMTTEPITRECWVDEINERCLPGQTEDE